MLSNRCKRSKISTRFQRQSVLSLRDAYFKELKIHLDQDDDGKLVVDKLPLNIVHVGLIHRVFPDAKFILALRHPCDCVLSCFMQPFKLNEAMMNFLSLQQSAEALCGNHGALVRLPGETRSWTSMS